MHRQIIETIGCIEKGRDPRAYAEIRIEKKMFRDLLDSAASVSLLGKNYREVVEELGI